MTIVAATLFSGIGAPETAMPAWRWLWHAEIEAAPSAVMKARRPESINLGDVNAEDFVERAERVGRPEVLVFGSPCQSFSVAGKRLGMDDARGNLALVGLGIARRLRPRWLVFENVPGLFSSYSGSDEAERALVARGEREQEQWRRDGLMPVADGEEDSDFAAFLSAVRECGYLGCYRVFDAQHSGVPQRRRRIFFVGHLGDWRPAAAVLLEPESLRGDSPPRREAREGVAGAIETSVERSRLGDTFGIDSDCFDRSGDGAGKSAAERSGLGIQHELSSALRAKRPNGVAIAPPLNAGMGKRRSSGAHGDAMIGMPMVANPLTARMGKGVNTTADEGQTMIPVAVVSADLRNGSVNSEVAQTIQAAGIGAERGGNPNAIPHVLAFDTTQITHPENRSKPDDRFPQLSSSAHPPAIAFDCKAGGNTSFSIGDIPGALRGDGHGGGHAAVVVDVASPLMAQDNRTGGNRSPGMCADSAAGQLVTVFKPSHFTRGKDGAPDDRAPPLSADADKGDQDPVLMHGAAVRRLTPRECERLQGFEDDYTLVKYRGKPMADGPRYRALGNSMNVLDIRAILRRIEEFERIRGAA